MTRHRGSLLLGALVLLLACAHMVVRPRAWTVRGPLLVLDQLYTLAATLGLLALCHGLGDAALRRLRVAWEGALEQSLFAVATGVGLLGTAFLALGAAGGFTAPAMAGFLVAAGLAARRELAGVPDRLSRAAREVRETVWPAALLVLAVVAAVIVTQALAPPVDYDSLMYHLDIPRDFLQRGRIFVPPDNLHVAQIGLLHMLYVPLLAFVGESGPAVLVGLLTVLLGLATFAFGMRFFSRETANVALIALWGSPMLVIVASTAKVDAALPYFLLLSLHALMAGEDAAESPRLWLAGILLGFAIGVKLFALPFALACVPLLLWQVWRSSRRSRSVFSPALQYYGGAFLAAAPWLLKSAILVGAPLYPLFTSRLPEPWVVDLYGSPERVPSAADTAYRALEFARARFNLQDFLFFPEKLTPELEGRLYTLNPLFLLLPIGILLVRARRFAEILIVGVLYSLLILVRGYINLRYLMPAFPVLTVGAAESCGRLITALSRSARRTQIASAVAFVCLVPTGFAVVSQIRLTGVLHVTTGMATREDFLRYGGNQEVVDYASMVDSVEARLAPTDRVLMLFEAKGYYLGSRVVQDNLLTNWTYLSYSPRLASCLQSTGFTHVLVAQAAIRYYADRGLDPRSLRWERFPEFAARCLIPDLKIRGYTLYRLRPSDPGRM